VIGSSRLKDKAGHPAASSEFSKLKKSFRRASCGRDRPSICLLTIVVLGRLNGWRNGANVSDRNHLAFSAGCNWRDSSRRDIIRSKNKKERRMRDAALF
jgi:hypothetical protein